MGFSTLMLANHATITDGLVNVLSGGVNRLHRGSFPAPMQVHLVAIIDLPAGYAGEELEFTVTVLSDDRRDIFARFDGLFATQLHESAPEKGNTAPVLLDLSGVLLPREGAFIIEAQLKGEEARELHFSVVKPEFLEVPNVGQAV